MKKVLSVILCFVLMITFSVTAFADTPDRTVDQDAATQAGNVAVGFGVDPTYIVTIPATVELEKKNKNNVITYEKDYTLKANDVRLLEGEVLEVKIASDFKLKTSEEAVYELPYQVFKQGETTALTANSIAASFDTLTTEQTQVLNLKADNPQYAGNFSDTVTFTVAVVNQ